MNQICYSELAISHPIESVVQLNDGTTLKKSAIIIVHDGRFSTHHRSEQISIESDLYWTEEDGIECSSH